ncbi:AAA family ATPase [Sphingopyxis fribergensis]
MAEEVQNYRVLFARGPGTDAPKDPGTIVIAPDLEDREVGRFRIGVVISVYPRFDFDIDTVVRVPGYIGFSGGPKRSGDLTDLIEAFVNETTDVLPSDKLPSYFTMLPELQPYRDLVSRLGAEEAGKVLRDVRDMMFAEDRHIGGIWFRAAKDSDVFNLGFLRRTDSYFAWKNAASILQGEDMEQTGLLSETLRITFQLSGRPNPHDIDFRFSLKEPVLPKRFAVVIGKNGVGKSQTLGRIARGALRDNGELTDGKGERPELTRLLAFHPTAGSGSVFPSQRRGGRIWYRRFALTHAGHVRGRQTTSDVIVNLARVNERIAGTERMEIFLTALRAIDGYHDIALLHRPGIPGYFRLFDVWEGNTDAQFDRLASVDVRNEPVRVVGDKTFPLSSGELAFVRFAALASLFIENSSLLLFDEPETHLHPNFISQFVALLDTLLEQTGSAAIIATHSSYFVRETFQDQVRVLRSRDDGMIEVIEPRLRTFGADVGSISQFVFGEGEPSRLASQVEKRIAASGQPWEKIFEQYRDELSLDLLSGIRAEVEDRG